jgi:hypothetical protein
MDSSSRTTNIRERLACYVKCKDFSEDIVFLARTFKHNISFFGQSSHIKIKENKPNNISLIL